LDLFLEISHFDPNENKHLNITGNIDLAFYFNENITADLSRSEYEQAINNTNDSVLNEALSESIDILIKNIFGNGIENILDTSFSCTEWQLHSKLTELF